MDIPGRRALCRYADRTALVLKNWSDVTSDIKPKSGVDLLHRKKQQRSKVVVIIGLCYAVVKSVTHNVRCEVSFFWKLM